MQGGNGPGRWGWLHKIGTALTLAALICGFMPRTAAAATVAGSIFPGAVNTMDSSIYSGSSGVNNGLGYWNKTYGSASTWTLVVPTAFPALDGKALIPGTNGGAVDTHYWINTEHTATTEAQPVDVSIWIYKAYQPDYNLTQLGASYPTQEYVRSKAGVVGLYWRNASNTAYHVTTDGMLWGGTGAPDTRAFTLNADDLDGQPVGTWKKYTGHGIVPSGAVHLEMTVWDGWQTYVKNAPTGLGWLAYDSMYVAMNGTGTGEPSYPAWAAPADPRFVSPTPDQGATDKDLSDGFAVTVSQGTTSVDVILTDENNEGDPYTASVQVDTNGMGPYLASFAPSAAWIGRHGAAGFMHLAVTARNANGSSGQIVRDFRYDPIADIPETDPAWGIWFDQPNPWEPVNMPNNATITFNGSAFIGKVFDVFQDGYALVRDQEIEQRAGSNTAGGSWPLVVNFAEEGLHTIRVVVHAVDDAGRVSTEVYAEKSLTVNYIQAKPTPATCHNDPDLGLFEKAMCWAFVPQGYYQIEWAQLQTALGTHVPFVYVAKVWDGMAQFRDGAGSGWTEGWRMPYAWTDGAGGVEVRYAVIGIGAWARVYDTTRLISRVVFLGWLLTWAYRRSQQFLSM